MVHTESVLNKDKHFGPLPWFAQNSALKLCNQAFFSPQRRTMISPQKVCGRLDKKTSPFLRLTTVRPAGSARGILAEALSRVRLAPIIKPKTQHRSIVHIFLTNIQ